MLNQFNATIFRAPIVAAVACHRGQRAGSLRGEARRSDAILDGEGLDDGIGAAARQVHVGGYCADIIGMADYEELERGLLLQEVADFLQGSVGLGFDIGFAGIEVDAVHRGMALGGNVFAERLGIDCDEVERLFGTEWDLLWERAATEAPRLRGPLRNADPRGFCLRKRGQG